MIGKSSLKIENPWGLPGSKVLLFTHATGLTTPTDPPEPCLYRFLSIGFQQHDAVAICFARANEAVTSIQGLRSPLWPM
jgi:hypothetical protein